MQKTVHLPVQSGCNFLVAMSNVQATDAARQVDKSVSVHILDAGAFCARHKNGSNLRDPARDSLSSAPRQHLRLRPGDRRLQVNGRHQYHPIGCSFKLM
jgi:hypothetical protein